MEQKEYDMRLTDANIDIMRNDKIYEAVRELRKRNNDWYARTELNLYYDKNCVIPDTILECNIYCNPNADGNKLQRYAFIAFEYEKCDKKMTQVINLQESVERYFAAQGSVIYGIDSTLILNLPNGKRILYEIWELEKCVRDRLYEIGFEFHNGDNLARTSVVGVDDFLKSWEIEKR